MEIGTYTGYGSSASRKASPRRHAAHHRHRPIPAEMVHRYIEKAGMLDRITMHHRPALEVIPTCPAFDLVFIDADKQNYRTTTMR